MATAVPKAAPIIKCKLCGQSFPFPQLPRHRREKHRAEWLASSAKGGRSRKQEGKVPGAPGEAPAEAPGEVGSKDGKDGKGTKVAATIAEAQFLTIYPKSFTMSSSLVWQAREAAIREWNWPADITPEDFWTH